jgi:pimeloyl-ACP methyl ester carboxylesterase
MQSTANRGDDRVSRQERPFKKGARFDMSTVSDDIERIPASMLAVDGGWSKGVFYRSEGTRPAVGVLMVHPRMDQSQNYNLLPLIGAGYAAMGCGCRYVHNDSEAVHEKILLDIAAQMRFLRQHGCEQVVLIGNSGGGGLLTLYQSQARTDPPGRISHTAAGDPFDLNAVDLPPADAVVLIGAHPGEGSRLMEWLDPSVLDEANPLSVDPELDMYDPANGFRIPPEPSSYSDEFVTRFRAAQLERARRLDERAFTLLGERAEAGAKAGVLEAHGDLGSEWRSLTRRARQADHMVIYRTLACPAWLDHSRQPDDRDWCSFNNDPRPDLANYESSLAAFLTPEAYLTTWSGSLTFGKTDVCLTSIPDPTLIVHYRGDSITRLEEAENMLASSAATDKDLIFISGADHYGFEILGPHQRGERTREGTDAVVSWVMQRFPLAGG